MAIGVQGVISVIANLLPKEFSQMVNLCLDGDFKKASETQIDLSEFIDLLFEEGNPVGIKAAMSLSNLCVEHLRLPLVPASVSLRERIKKMLIQIK